VDVQGALSDTRTHPAWFELKTGYQTSAKEAEELANFATHLALQIEADCGLVDFRPDPPDEQMNPSGREHAALVATTGLQVLYGRTLIAAKDVNRYGGLEGLRRAGLRVTLVANTIYQVDLLPAPWSCSAREMKEAQLRALNSLRSDGFFHATAAVNHRKL
jgi:hypothetical protein